MINGLYLITPHGDEADILRTLEHALSGGARVVQYRDKERDVEAQIKLARRLGINCRAAGAIFLINDNAEIALKAEADGVHLGQDDQSVHDARKLLGPDKLIGVSTRTVDQALQAEAAGADYIGVGSIFPTATKEDAKLIGIDALRKIRRAVQIPLVAIGGVNANNGDEAIDAGADALAVVSAISSDANPALAARELSLMFNRKQDIGQTRVLTIAGSDPSGGAGIQADIKTISLLGSYAASAITALTAQNTLGVKGVSPVSADFVAKQSRMVLDDIGADTLKTGMLYGAETVCTVAKLIKEYNLLSVIDPVMIAKGGAALLKPDAVEALRSELLSAAYLLTPNIPEAEALTGLKIESVEEMEGAAEALQQMGARNLLIKGGHKEGDATDVLLTSDGVLHLTSERTETENTHGTGCSYAAALATLLAQGQPLKQAAQQAKTFISAAIAQATPLGQGHGPINHVAGAQALRNEST